MKNILILILILNLIPLFVLSQAHITGKDIGNNNSIGNNSNNETDPIATTYPLSLIATSLQLSDVLDVPQNGSLAPISSNSVFDNLALKQNTLVGNESIFSTWDKNANDDFDGVFNSLTARPTINLSGGNTTGSINLQNLTATITANVTGGVSSFNSRTGAIVPVVGDYASFYIQPSDLLSIITNGSTAGVQSNAVFDALALKLDATADLTLDNLSNNTTDDLPEGTTNKYDQTVVITDGGNGNVTVGGTYPNFTLDVPNSTQVIVENVLTSTSTTNALSAAQGKALKDAQSSHIAATDNPHSVTKAQVGLGNVDNTSDANKPISTATQNALNLKQDISSALQLGVTPTTALAGDTPIITTSERTKLSNVSEGVHYSLATLLTEDGSGSGLDAELVTGTRKGNSNNGTTSFIPVISTGLVLEGGRYIDFHNSFSDGLDYQNRLSSESIGNLSINGNTIYHTGNLPTNTNNRTVIGLTGGNYTITGSEDMVIAYTVVAANGNSTITLPAPTSANKGQEILLLLTLLANDASCNVNYITGTVAGAGNRRFTCYEEDSGGSLTYNWLVENI